MLLFVTIYSLDGYGIKFCLYRLFFFCGVLAAAIMAQMELDYAQYVVEENPNDIRCILTTDAKSAFQSASRHN